MVIVVGWRVEVEVASDSRPGVLDGAGRLKGDGPSASASVTVERSSSLRFRVVGGDIMISASSIAFGGTEKEEGGGEDGEAKRGTAQTVMFSSLNSGAGSAASVAGERVGVAVGEGAGSSCTLSRRDSLD